MIRIDTVEVRAFRDDRPLELRLGEYRMLACLAHAKGPVGAGELLHRVFGLQIEPKTNRIAAILSRLRSKLGDPGIIVTRSATYQLVEEVIVEPRL